MDITDDLETWFRDEPTLNGKVVDENTPIPEDGPDKDGDSQDDDIQDPAPSTPPVDTPPASAPATPPADDSVETDERIATYIDFLREQNFFDLPEDYKFEATADGLQKALEENDLQRWKKTGQAYFDSLPDQFKPLLSYALKGGDSVDEWVRLHSTQNFETLSPEKEEDQKAILFQYYKQTSPHDDDRIQRMISRLKSDEMLEAATEAYQDLLDLKATKQAELEDEIERREQERIETSKKQVEELTKTIETSPSLDNTRRNKVKGFFVNQLSVAGEEPTTEFSYTIKRIFSNPEHLVQLADLIMDYDPKKGISTARFEKKGATKETAKFKSLIDTKLGSLPTNTHTGSTNGKDNFDLQKFMQLN